MDSARSYGKALARICKTKDGWTYWHRIHDDYSFMIRGKIRNRRQHVANPLIEICLSPLPKESLVLKMDWQTFYKINQTLLRHEFWEDKEGYRIVKAGPNSFAIQRDGIEWYNKNPGDTFFTMLHFPRKFFEQYRETEVSMDFTNYFLVGPYNRLCLFEEDLFVWMGDKTDKRHGLYTEDYPPPEPLGQNTTFESAPIITDVKKELNGYAPCHPLCRVPFHMPDEVMYKEVKLGQTWFPDPPCKLKPSELEPPHKKLKASGLE